MHLTALAEPFIVGHEKQAILAIEQLGDRHRPAKHKAELVPLKGILPGAVRRESVVFGIQLVVTEELIQGTVIDIAATLRRDVDLRRAAAKFGRVHTALHLKLLQRFHGRENYVGVEVRVGVLNAVQREAVKIVALTGDRDVLIRPITTLPPIGLASRREAKAHVRG